MTSDSSVGGLSLHNTVTINANRGHKTKGSETLGNNVRHHITIVVLASPYEATTALNSLSYEIINETMFVVDTFCIEISLVICLKFFFENIHEQAIVLLEDSVLSG